MNILVCFKAVSDPEMLFDEDWVIDENLQINTGFIKPSLNVYDESGLEMALRLRDAAPELGVNVKLTGLTVDDASADTILKTLNALRFDRVARIDTQDDIRFRPAAVASLLSQYVIQQAPQDLLLLGRQTSVGENFKTGPLLAEMLGWPCITEVNGIELADKRHLRVTCQVDDGRLRQTVQTPCVLCVGDVPFTHMRVPTLLDRMKFGKRPAEVLPAPDFETVSPSEELIALETVRHERPGRVIEGDSPREKAWKLYEEHLRERLAEP